MKSDKITRSVGGTIGFAIAAFALAAGAAWLFESGHPIIGGIAAFVALSLGLQAIIGPRRAICPHCGAEWFDPSDVVLCGKCRQYSRKEADTFVPVEANFVASSPVFPVHVDRLVASGSLTNIVWPQRCSVCGDPAVRTERLQIVMESPGALRHMLTVTFKVPHCHQHRKGVIMYSALDLRFRSYSYWRDFCGANQIDFKNAGQST